jgi:GT2 family glycosyltransferase
MTTNWINKVKPWHKDWKDLPEKDKENFYRHNYIHRPENIRRRELEGAVDPMLKVVRNWIKPEQDEQAALSEVTTKIEDHNEQLSKAGRKASKNGKKI